MRHLDDNLLLMILDGQVPPRVLLQAMYAHLRELCPECRTTLEQVAGDMGWALDDGAPAEPLPLSEAPGAAGASAYAAAFEAASHRALHCAEGLDDERRNAERELAELLSLPASERFAVVTAARSRFRSRSLAERVLDEVRESVRRDPDEAGALAELVPAMLAAMPGAGEQTWGEELHARALAHRGNALRVAGDLTAAESTFVTLHRFLRDRSLQLVDLHPEVASLEASLRREQGRFHDAVELLDTAVKLAQVAGDTAELASFLIKRGDVHRLNGNLDQAHDDLRRTLSLLEPEKEPHLFQCAVGNYCLYLCEAGEHEEAARLLERHRAMFDRPDDPWVNLRTAVLRGYIAHGRGDSEAAEREYLYVRDWYAAHDQPFRAALASIELARLYLEQGRHREMAELANWMGKVFEHRELPTRAAVALMLFQQAVAAEQITLDALHGLEICLQQAQTASLRGVHKPS